MHCKFITFLFLGVTVFCATVKHNQHNEMLAAKFRRNQLDVTEFILINPKQIQYAEIAIKRFLAKLTGSIVQPITLRLSSLDGGSLQETISEICKTIREKIMEFAQASGLTTSVRQYEQTSWNSTISEDWFTESLAQGSLLLCDLIRIGEEIISRINRYFDTHNIILHEDEKLSRKTENFKFLSTINDAARFNEQLFKCLSSLRNRKNSSSFDFIRIIKNLTKGSPGNTVRSFKSSLDQAFSVSKLANGTNSKQLYVLLCHSLVERTSHYGDCIKELRRLAACVSPSRQDSNEVIAHTLPAKAWLAAIEHLSGCKIYITDGTTSISCNLKRRLPSTAAGRVKYIYEKILDRRIFGRSSLHRVANELGNVLSRSRWGRQLTYDVCQYFAIYQEGRRKLNALSKNAAKDKKAVTRYNKISASLNIYKNGVLRKMILTIGNFHRSALEMQKFFALITRPSSKIMWHRILSLLSDFMTQILLFFGYINLEDTDIPITTDISLMNMTDSNSAMESDNFYDRNNQYNLVVYHKKDQIKKKIDEAFERLITAMNDVSRVRSRNGNSTLGYLANNLLLVAMFMETLSFVSTLFSLGKYKNESNLEESTEEWDSSVRERRSLLLTNFEETDTTKNDISMIFEASEEIVNISNEKSVNFIRSVPVDITNNFSSLIKGNSNKYKIQREIVKPILLK